MLKGSTRADPRVSRRTLNAMLISAASIPLLNQKSLNAQAVASPPRPFRVEIPQAKIDLIFSQVRDAEWPDRLDAPDLRYGISWDYMKELADYWTTKFDWRTAEANLNKHPQFLARVGDYDIHFYHVKGRGPKPLPLVLTHGWPGSVFEFAEAIGPLSDPASYGGSAEDAFDVIVPSMPGFGFSSKPNKPIGRPTVAALWNGLMTEVLGYSKYGAQGGDIGAFVTLALAVNHKDSMVGVHFNGLAEGRQPPPDAEQTPDERAWRRAVNAYTSIVSSKAQKQRKGLIPNLMSCSRRDAARRQLVSSRRGVVGKASGNGAGAFRRGRANGAAAAKNADSGDCGPISSCHLSTGIGW